MEGRLGGPHRDLSGAWGALTKDPVGVLLPAAALLLIDVAVTTIAPLPTATPAFAAAIAIWLALRSVVRTSLRLSMLRAGARALEEQPQIRWNSWISLWLVDTVRGTAATAVAAAVFVPTALMITWLFRHQLQVLAGLVIAVAALLGLLLWLIARAIFAPAVSEVILGKGPFRALIDGVTLGKGQFPAIGVLIVAGDLATGLGGALCGAGALPGYPITDLAVLHRTLSLHKERANVPTG